MKETARMVAVALFGLAACNQGESNVCSTPGLQQCTNNTMQTCASNAPLGAGNSWYTDIACVSPQVCRLETAGGIGLPGESGCFDPNAYCPYEGYAVCDSWWPTALWSCVLRASDSSLQWATTDCPEQVPRAICAGNLPPNAPPAVACYDVIENCPLFPTPDIHCEGNVLFQCTYNVVNDKVVADWTMTDCTLSGAVCRSEPVVGTHCATP